MGKEATESFKVGYAAIVGRPNVGKSTLLNRLLDFKVAAVTRKPQTTRHQIRGILTGESYQIIFLDTPGLLQPKYQLHEAMLRSTLRALQDSDSVLFMIEATRQLAEEDLQVLEETFSSRTPVILAINKMDTIRKEEVLPVVERLSGFEKVRAVVPISALKSYGLDALLDEIVASLPEGHPLYDPDVITDHPERFVAAEIIREKIIQRYGDEIPYSTTVSIDEFKERESAKDFIRAVIYVERVSQKGILIGKHGAALKEVGRASRQDIEQILGRPVFLELWVKVKEKWRQDEKLLKDFGYY